MWASATDYIHMCVDLPSCHTHSNVGFCNEDISWLAGIINENPNAIRVLLPGSKIDIIRQLVKAGEEYVNPFTTKSAEDIVPSVYDHDTYITHIVGIELGKNGSKFADMLAMKVMGF